MRIHDLPRTGWVLLCLGALLAVQAGCSRGSSSGSSLPAPTATNAGVPTPTPTPVIVDSPGANLTDVIKNFPNGGTFVVSPGTYGPIELTGDDIGGPLTLRADETGAFTGRPGTITILAQDKVAAINLDGLDNVVIDGVSTVGGNTAGMLFRNGSQIVLLNNKVREARGDGIRLERSSAVLVFNNLIYANDGTGLTARGVNTMETVNNTIHGNAGGGLSYLRLAFPGGSEGSPFGFVINNIIDGNLTFGLRVDGDSAFGFEGNYNINNDGYTGVEPGDRDLIADPLFVFPPRGDFRLQSNVGVGGSPAFDRGDPNTETFFVESLRERTTRTDSFRDIPPVDLGYHYPGGIDTPTPVPTFTPQGQRAPSSTPTFTPTATSVAAAQAQTAGDAAGSSAGGATSDSVVIVPTPTATATPVAD